LKPNLLKIAEFFASTESLITCKILALLTLGFGWVICFSYIVAYIASSSAFKFRVLIVFWAFSVALAVVGVLGPKKLLIPIALIFTLIIVPIVLANLGCQIVLGEKLSESHFYVIFETNANESIEYLTLNFSPWMIGLLFGVIIVPLVSMGMVKSIIKKSWPKWRIRLILSFCTFLAFVLLPIAVAFPSYANLRTQIHSLPIFSSSINAIYSYAKNVCTYRKEAARFLENKNIPTINRPVSLIDKEETFVLIIGESTNRNHMGIYGYPRNTTPELYKKRHNLYIFRDVISPASHTVPALQMALTSVNRENIDAFYTVPSIIDFARKTGFKTYWISNQSALGVWDNTIAILGRTTDVSFFINTTGTSKVALDGISFDGKILSYLDRVIEDGAKKKFIIIHLMGIHTRYWKRFPKEFEAFKDMVPPGLKFKQYLNDNQWKRQLIDFYDNAILYNDYVVSQVIDRVKKDKRRSFVLYFSDHGEEVCDYELTVGHRQVNYTPGMVEIPFVLWLSKGFCDDSFIKRFGDCDYIFRRYTTEHLFHSLADIMSFRFESLELEKSVFSSQFGPMARHIGKKDYDENLLKWKERGEPSLRQKIWVHRVNSLEKLEQVAGQFAGIEVDVVFDSNKNRFDVNHPPAKSIGLTLRSFLEKVVSVIRESGSLDLWLDVKNANHENIDQIIMGLEKLGTTYDLKDHLFIELDDIELCEKIKSEGFFVMYGGVIAYPT